ncbi:MAG: hypothetical protein IPH91_06745 [Elusimicrobia bacterium]|nr:hypothetical protein [Elusimicrobiota bacterium]
MAYKFLSGFLSLAIVLGPVNSFAYDDDYTARSSYRPQDYQSNNRPQNNYSPSYQLDRQVRNLNAALSFRQNVGFINPKLDIKPTPTPLDTFKPKIQFQLASANIPKPTVQDLKVNPTIPSPTVKTGLLGVIQNLFKGIGSGFQKIGQAIGNAIQRLFTRAEKPGAISPQQRDIISQYPNLQPTGPNTFTSVAKITYAFGKVWEPGSTFSATNGIFQLNQGVTLESSFGGIKDKSGGLLPIRMTTVDGNITPVGLDFDRLKTNTVLQVTQPTEVEGFGTIHPGEMAYQAPIKDAANATIGGRFSLQGVKVDLNRDAADQFGMDTSVTLKQANFTLQAGLMRLNSAVLEQGNKRLFVQESKPPLDIQEITQKTNAIDNQSEGLTDHIGKMSQSLENRSLASSVLFNNLAQQTGSESRISFGFSDGYKALKAEVKAADQQLAKIQTALKNGDYTHISPDQVDRLGEKMNSLSTMAETLTEQTEPVADFQKALSGMTAGLKDITLSGGDIRTMQGAERITDDELNRRTALYFPEEKAKIKAEAEKAIYSLQSMVMAGQMTPDQAAIATLEILTMRDKVYAAKPNNVVSEGINASFDVGKGLVDRSVDFMYFNQLNYLAEKFPKAGEAFGTYMLASAQGAKIFSQAVGVGGLVYFGFTATVSTGAMLLTAYGVAKVAEKMGVDEAPANLMGFLASIGLAKVLPLQKADVSFREFVKSRAARFSTGLREAVSSHFESMKSESGRIYIGGRSSNVFVRSNLPKLQGTYRAAFEGPVELRTFKAGDVLYRSPSAKEPWNKPGPWYTTRETVTVTGTESTSNIKKWGNPVTRLRAYELYQDVTVYYGKVKGGTGYQALFPQDVDTSAVLNYRGQTKLK